MTLLESSYWSAPAPARIANGIMFNISWLAIVVSQSAVIAPLILLVHLALHFRLMGKGRDELYLIAKVALLGALIDQLLFRTGVFNIAGEPSLPPIWLACLWPLFATTLLHAFEGLQRKPLLAACLGVVGGSLSYTAGVRLSSVEFSSLFWGPVIMGVVWGIVCPLLLVYAGRLNTQDKTLQSWTPAVRRSID
jgi:hypothetical protein